MVSCFVFILVLPCNWACPSSGKSSSSLSESLPSSGEVSVSHDLQKGLLIVSAKFRKVLAAFAASIARIDIVKGYKGCSCQSVRIERQYDGCEVYMTKQKSGGLRPQVLPSV